MTISKESGIPKYVQLRAELLRQVSAGTLRPGDKFCTQGELMEKFGLSFATVTHALRDLSREGYIVRRKGKGTFVAAHPALAEAAKRRGDDIPLLVAGDSFKYRADEGEGSLSWFVFDEIQKGIVNSYNGAVRFVSEQELAGSAGARAIVLNPSPECVEALKKASVPFVAIDHRRGLRLSVNSVSWEMMFGVYDLMAWLIRDLGHRRIACIGGDFQIYFADRFAAYSIGLAAHSIPFREDYVIRGLHGSETDGYEAMKRLLALPEPPTAVFADTDGKAFGALRAVREAGLKAPDDISVAGFDDMPGAESFSPALTTVKIPYYEMGARAVEMLQSKLESGVDQETVVLKSSLLVRASCSKCKETA